MSVGTILLIVFFAVLIAVKALLIALGLGAVVEEGYRREMRAHGFDPGPLPWWMRKARLVGCSRRRRSLR